MTNWPTKTRDLHNHHMDSTIWDRFAFRDDDVIVATYAKSGTTWTQQIVGQLLFAGDPDVQINALSPWLDLRVMPPDTMAQLEAQTHRRIVKTHLPLDALTFSPKASMPSIDCSSLTASPRWNVRMVTRAAEPPREA